MQFSDFLVHYKDGLKESDVEASKIPGEFKYKNHDLWFIYKDTGSDPFKTWKRFRRMNGSTEAHGNPFVEGLRS